MNLDLTDPAMVVSVLVHNNTFLNVESWLGLVVSKTDQAANVTFANNLILRSQSIQGSQDRILGAAKNWRFHNNQWEVPSSIHTSDATWQPFAKLQERIELLNRTDRDRADYLRPPPGSPLFQIEDPLDDLPHYVGAFGPGHNRVSDSESIPPGLPESTESADQSQTEQ